MTQTQVYHYLIAKRANLPPLKYQDGQEWEDFLVDFLKWNDDYNDEDPLPFSVDFSVTIPREKIDAYDYNARDPACLGHEPETANIAAFKIWYDSTIGLQAPIVQEDNI